jgi:excinuclease UvrABC nuclease subunit
MQRTDLTRFKLPDEPGVYTFKKGRKILYIGKAASLRDRVRSYFATDLSETRGLHITKMVTEATTLDWQLAHSVLEALILEANLIKRHMPPYNAASKDNKSFNYLVVTKEDFPRILIVRGRELFSNAPQAAGYKLQATFGPFPQGLSLREAVKMVRRIFPFRDNKCTPCIDQLKKGKKCRACFNRQIGLCPGVCTGEVTKEEYARTVRHITTLFSGNFQGLKRQLTSRMKAASEGERFEEAAQLKRQIHALTHIKDVSLIKDERVSTGGGARIEAFDVAHTAGAETVAVMTVVDGGEAVKAAYRKFKIQSVTNDDVAAICEALERRLGHPEWPLPRVFAIDGGKAQMRAAERVLKKAGVMIPIVGIVKDEFHRPKGLIGDTRAIEAYERDILLANSEAHRFAISWHRRRRQKAMF